MDILGQTITLAGIITVGMFIIAFLNYRLAKNNNEKSEKKETAEEIKAKADKEKEEAERLISIEKDVQYIRLQIDNYEKKMEDHEHRIAKLERRPKGGK